MPGVGGSPPVTSLDEDTEAVREAVLKELEDGRDVVVHAHSWAGVPVNNVGERNLEDYAIAANITIVRLCKV